MFLTLNQKQKFTTQFAPNEVAASYECDETDGLYGSLLAGCCT